MATRYFVYDIDTTMEDFIASFSSRPDAVQFGAWKFGDKAYVTDVAHHDKAKKGKLYQKRVKRR